MGAAMSLREFIRATARDVQVTLQAKSAQETVAGQKGASSSTAAVERSEEEEGREEGLARKKAKKSSRDSREDEGAQKRRRKERARKSIEEGEKRDEAARVTERIPRLVEEKRPEEETELPATPSGGLIETTTSPFVEIEDVDESPCRAGPSTPQTTYQPAWESIFEETMLNSPILRAEWVARALPPGELRSFERARIFDICDVANRAAILVRERVYE